MYRDLLIKRDRQTYLRFSEQRTIKHAAAYNSPSIFLLRDDNPRVRVSARATTLHESHTVIDAFMKVNRPRSADTVQRTYCISLNNGTWERSIALDSLSARSVPALPDDLHFVRRIDRRFGPLTCTLQQSIRCRLISRIKKNMKKKSYREDVLAAGEFRAVTSLEISRKPHDFLPYRYYGVSQYVLELRLPENVYARPS